MNCNWIINIYECNDNYVFISKIGLSIHLIVLIFGILTILIKFKYLWKGLYNQKTGLMPIECFLVLSLISFTIRIIYIICKIVFLQNYILISFFYGAGWLPGMIGYNIYYIKVIENISNHLDNNYILPNSKNMKLFIILQILVICVLVLVFSIISGIYINKDDYKYFIFFGIVQFTIGLGMLIIGMISIFYGIQNLKFTLNNNINKGVDNSIFSIGLILIIVSIFAIPVSLLWFYTAINFKYIINNNEINLPLFIVWDVICGPLLFLITYIVILMYTRKKYNKI